MSSTAGLAAASVAAWAARGSRPARAIWSVSVSSRAIARHLLAAALLLPCAGCMVGPDFTSPSAPVAGKWLESNNPSVDTRNQEYRDWWKVFHDPVLNRLIEIAYNQNLTLVSAGTKVLEARAQLGVAIGEFYPQLQQGHGSVTYIRPGHADTTQFPSGVTQNFWRDSLGLTVNWELDFWGKFRRAIESADAAYLASIANYDYVLATLLGDVATTYIGIRTLQTQIEIARDNIVKQKKALAIAEAKYHGGTATKLDVYQAENVLGQTEAAIPQLTIQLNQGFNALAVLLGMSPQPMDPLLRGSSGIPVPPKTVAVGIPADLVRRRPDIRAAEALLHEASARVGVATASLYPQITLSGTAGSLTTAIGNLLSGGTGFALLGASLAQPLFHGGQLRAEKRAAVAAYEQAGGAYREVVLEGFRDVADTLSALDADARSLHERAEASSLARSAFEIASKRYDAGGVSLLEKLDAERLMRSASLEQIDAVADRLADSAALFQALGGGWWAEPEDRTVAAQAPPPPAP